jgi:hypothetical protein
MESLSGAYSDSVSFCCSWSALVSSKARSLE